MSMSKEGMAASIESYVDLITMPAQSTGGDVGSARTLILEAICQGIIDEIVSGAVVATTSGAPDGEHTGNITS